MDTAKGSTMNTKVRSLVCGILLIAAPAFAHVGVRPAQSTPGALETYTLRVPSEGGRTTTAVVLAVPDGVTVTSVSAPTGAKHEEKRTADRVVEVTWTIEIKAGARAELSFVAKNPSEGASIIWKVTQKYSDGSSSAWAGPRGDRSPAPVTKLVSGTGDTSIKIPDTVDGIFKAIEDHHHKLAETVKNKKLADVHHIAFAIRDLAKALPAKAAADKKKQVEGTVNNLAKLADDLDESGDANEQGKTEANLKKLDGLLKVLETQFGKRDQ
jgi:uncharacterized protein YcnI